VQIPFGKYRDTSVTELPFHYLQWLTSIDRLDPLRAEVKKEYGGRLYDQCQYEGSIDLKVIDEVISAGVRGWQEFIILMPAAIMTGCGD